MITNDFLQNLEKYLPSEVQKANLKREVAEYYETHTAPETAKKFRIHERTVLRYSKEVGSRHMPH